MMNLSLSGLMARDGRAGCASSESFASGAPPTVSSVLTNKLPIRLRVRACDLRIRPIIRPDKSQIAFIVKPEGRGNLTLTLIRNPPHANHSKLVGINYPNGSTRHGERAGSCWEHCLASNHWTPSAGPLQQMAPVRRHLARIQRFGAVRVSERSGRRMADRCGFARRPLHGTRRNHPAKRPWKCLDIYCGRTDPDRSGKGRRNPQYFPQHASTASQQRRAGDMDRGEEAAARMASGKRARISGYPVQRGRYRSVSASLVSKADSESITLQRIQHP
jgi:hypothetical protein